MTSIIKSYEKPFKDWSPDRQEQWKRGILKNILELNRYPISVEALSQGKDIKPESIVNIIFGILGKSNKDFPIPLEGTLSPSDAKGVTQGQEYAIFLWNYYLGIATNTPSEKKEKAKSFISGTSSSESTKKVTAKTTSISNIIPKKTVPQEIAEKITSPSESGDGENDPVTGAPRGVVTSLGRLTLNLEQSNNNLEKIIEVVKEDYKTTKETNKKEIEDYRKRVSNRGKILGKKELGSDKVDLSGIIKKYVGSFFSGTGGAIRALAGINLVEGIMTGDPGKILGSLTGITASYLPAIGMAVGGKVAENLGKRLFLGGGRRSGGTFRGFGGVAKGAKPISRIARGGGRLALGAGLAAGALAIGGKIFGGGGEAQRVGDITNPKQDGQGGADVLMPKDSLKRFDDLNTKFEQAVNMLLSGGGGNGSGGSPDGSGNPAIRGTVSSGQFNNAQLVSLLKKAGATNDEAVRLAAIGMRESQGDPTTDTVKSGLDPQMKKEYSIGLFQINWKAHNSWLRGIGITNPEQLRDPITNAQAALEVKRNHGGFGAWSTNKSVTQAELNQGRGSLGNLPQLPPSSTTPPPSPVLPPPRYLPSPGGGQGITAVPVSAGAAAAPASGTSDGSEGPPAINTTYYENFLALYSKLIYQIV